MNPCIPWEETTQKDPHSLQWNCAVFVARLISDYGNCSFWPREWQRFSIGCPQGHPALACFQTIDPAHSQSGLFLWSGAQYWIRFLLAVAPMSAGGGGGSNEYPIRAAVETIQTKFTHRQAEEGTHTHTRTR